LNGDDMQFFVSVVVGSIGLLLLVVVLIGVVRQFMFICEPNEILVFSGREKQLPSGQKVGYRVIFGGRAYRLPFLEEVKRMDLQTMEVEVQARNAFCKGGIRINVDAIANVKISDDPRFVGNSIERFLGQDKDEIRQVAKNTLEGLLRSVLATLTPEEVNEDRLKFAESLANEAEKDLNKLGLHLDTFNIHSVSDVKESQYLSELGRKVIAEVKKNAEVSEAICNREATEKEAEAKSRSDVVAEQVETEVRTRTNELRKLKAELDSEAKSAEAQAEAGKETARARAEQELQKVRAELEGLRLQAEVVVKAEAESKAREFQARAEAAPIAARGKAMAEALDQVRQAWTEAGDGAKPIFMIQQLDTILRSVVDRVEQIRVDKVSILDNGDGTALPAYVASYPATVNAVLRELNGLTGIDVVGTLGEPGAVRGGDGRLGLTGREA
jgi:flotillin